MQTLRLQEEESNEDRLAIVSSTTKGATPPYNLPDGWVVEEVPRRLSSYNDKVLPSLSSQISQFYIFWVLDLYIYKF